MISLSSEIIFHLGPLPVTNTLLDTLLVDAILIGIVIYVRRTISLVPGFFQTIIELAFEALNSLTTSTAEDRAKAIFPYVMSFFLFILVANLSGLLPVLGAIGFYENGKLVPLFRSASSDLNTTLSLAIISLTATHAMSIRTIGFAHYIGRFISYKPMELYAGILELISEFTKIISFSFRLFGNIFVGEVLLAGAASFFAFLLPIPLVFYETFVAVIQALIFALLTMAFMAIFTTSHTATETD